MVTAARGAGNRKGADFRFGTRWDDGRRPKRHLLPLAAALALPATATATGTASVTASATATATAPAAVVRPVPRGPARRSSGCR